MQIGKSLQWFVVNRNICDLIELDEIAEVSRRKVLGGRMGVAKAGNDRNTGPQRLIMNNQSVKLGSKHHRR